jgi:hypothetical protein
VEAEAPEPTARPEAEVFPRKRASDVEEVGAEIRTTPEESPEGQETPGQGPFEEEEVSTISWPSTMYLVEAEGVKEKTETGVVEEAVTSDESQIYAHESVGLPRG